LSAKPDLNFHFIRLLNNLTFSWVHPKLPSEAVLMIMKMTVKKLENGYSILLGGEKKNFNTAENAPDAHHNPPPP
jgi:hypothetical protein